MKYVTEAFRSNSYSMAFILDTIRGKQYREKEIPNTTDKTDTYSELIDALTL